MVGERRDRANVCGFDAVRMRVVRVVADGGGSGGGGAAVVKDGGFGEWKWRK